MKGLIQCGVVALSMVVAFSLAATTVSAQDYVINTKHNFSNATRTTGTALPANLVGSDKGQVCVYCHTPHGGGTTTPLWNRTSTTTTFTMYTSTTLDMTIATAPDGVSLACLSCHDGTIGIDVVVNEPPGAPAVGTNTNLNDFGIGSPVLFDADLRNDHPISVDYDPTQDVGYFVAAANSKVGTLPLYGPLEQVECGSCHNPHEDAAALQPFLRMANTASALCRTCHIK